MKSQRKVTVLLPTDLINQALSASGVGLTPTLRKGLELVAARDAYEKLRALKGKFELDINLDDLRRDNLRRG